MPWYVVAVVVIVGVGGMLAGCGDVDGDGTNTPGPTACATPPTPTVPPTPTTPPTETPGTPPTEPPPPTPTPTIEWFEEEWLITHYIYALESDPIFANDDRVVVPGLDQNKMYRLNFIYGADPTGPRGVVWQGTGKAETGEYITIDYTKTDINGSIWNFVFTYGQGGAYAGSIPWETVGASDPRLEGGDKVVIAIYPDKVLTVTDTGTEIGDSHLDVFVGEMTLAEADALGRPGSKVGKVVEP
jgi:hypothetical protein